MLDKNVDVNVTNQKGDSLLATAISAGQIDAVRLLLARGARPSSIAFNLALSKNDPSIIQSLKAMDAKF